MDLQKLLIDVCKRAQLKKIPKLTVCKGAVAQTRLNKIHIGRRLSSHLTEEEMKGVIAHEVRHATKFSNRLATFILLLVPLLIGIAVAELIGYIALISKFPTLPYYPSTSIFLVIVLVSFLLYSIGLSRHESRTCELDADRFAASIVDGRVFTETLRKLEKVQLERGCLSRLKEWLCPHPPLDKRLEAIRNVKRLPYHAGQLARNEEEARPK